MWNNENPNLQQRISTTNTWITMGVMLDPAKFQILKEGARWIQSWHHNVCLQTLLLCQQAAQIIGQPQTILTNTMQHQQRQRFKKISMIQVPPSIAQPVPARQKPVATCHQNQRSQWGPNDPYPYHAAHRQAEIWEDDHTVHRTKSLLIPSDHFLTWQQLQRRF